MAKKLTLIGVTNAKPKRVGGVPVRTEIPDAGCSGLHLVIQPSGAKSWALRFRIAGVSRKLTLGAVALDEATAAPDALTLAAVRAAATAAMHQVERGKDPAADKRTAKAAQAAAQRAAAATDDSIAAKVAQFIEEHAKVKTRAVSWKATEGIFRREVLPVWRGKTIHDIERRDIKALLKRIVADGRPVMANRTWAVLSRFFNWLVEEEDITASPCAKINRPANEVERERTLDDHEVRALWLACGDPEIGTVAGPFVRMLMVTGCRRTEVAAMRWDEINEQERTWTIPPERSKNKRVHMVPLVPQAWAIIDMMPRLGEFVFTTDGVTHIKNFDKFKKKLDAKLQFATPYVIHDLRRTFASAMQALGVKIEVTEILLGHTSGVFKGIVKVYQKYDYAPEKRAALELWANRIDQLVSGKAAKVFSLGWESLLPAHRSAFV